MEYGQLVPSFDPEGTDFGNAVAIDGDVAVVGARFVDKVVVFRKSGLIWQMEDEIEGSDVAAGDEFGGAVALDGIQVVVGARRHDAEGFDAGAAYVFNFVGIDWIETAKLTAGEPVARAVFGSSVSLDGDRIVIGAPMNPPAAVAGAAYIFDFSGTSWNETAILTASNSSLGDDFGSSSLVEGDVVYVGSFENHPVLCCGSLYVFEKNGPNWTQTANIHPLFGGTVGRRSISADGSYVASETTVLDRSGNTPCIPALQTAGTVALGGLVLLIGIICIHRRRTGNAIIPLLLISKSSFPTAAEPVTLSGAYQPERLLVRFEPNASETVRNDAHSAAQGTEIRRFNIVPGLTLVRMAPRRIEAAYNSYRQQQRVVAVEPD